MPKDRYNLQHFNLSRNAKELFFKRTSVESVIAVVGATLYLGFNRTAEEKIESKTKLTITLTFKRLPTATILSNVNLCKEIVTKRAMTEIIDSKIVGSKIMFISWDMVEEFKSIVNLSKTVFMSRELNSEILSSVSMGKIMFYSVTAYEVILSETQASTSTHVTQTITVTIPPGGELRIDSAAFEIFMNGNGILHLHDGGWVWLERKTSHITISTGSGGQLSGEILYSEGFI